MWRHFPNQARIFLIIGFAVLFFAASIALAANDSDLPRSLIAGAGSRVSSGSISLSSSLGQPVAGAVSAGELTAIDGFWAGPGAPTPPPDFGTDVYLPMLIR